MEIDDKIELPQKVLGLGVFVRENFINLEKKSMIENQKATTLRIQRVHGTKIF